MNIISLENIKALKAQELTELLLKLLHLEFNSEKFPDCHISVPQNINTADGGEDGRIETSDHKNSKWVIDEFCLFQCKATEMGISECKNEILTKDKKSLKNQVKEIFDKGGTYILFTTDDYVVQNIDARIKSFREGIASVESANYAEKAKVKIYDANLIRDWTNQYITAISFVQFCAGMNRPYGIQIWSEFKSYSSNSNEFKSNREIDGIIEAIRQCAWDDSNLRIEGVSGIGKTRLICEAFSPGEKDFQYNFDVQRKSLSDKFIYFDLAKGDSQQIFDFIRSTVTNYPAILVLDNCDPRNHRKFIEEVSRTGSKQKLISLDYEKINDNIRDYNLIELKSEMYISIVEEILKAQYKGTSLSPHEISYLVNFSEGNPKMAINFVEAAIRNVNLNESFDEDLLIKLIFGRESKDEEEFKVLKLFSAFKYFEYPADQLYSLNSDEYTLLLEHVTFFAEFLSIDLERVRLIIKKYLSKGVLERRGNKLIIRPNPLSLKLSIIFWNELGIDKYEKFVEKIPKNLKNSLADQLTQLGNVDKAQELVGTIWGLEGNFSSAEILNSNMGSRLFRSIVTVNPIETLKVLKKHYLDKPKEYLLTIVDARQNLVWALEKLCFRRETFHDAAIILIQFARAEIETYYSNNSTFYFTQLFRIYLAGTEADYSSRIEVLKWAIEKKDPDYNILILKAAKNALTSTYNLHKTLGAENQGGQLPLKEYSPINRDEINTYRREVLDIIADFTVTKNELQFSAQRLIYSNLNELFQFGFDIAMLATYINPIFPNIVNKEDLKKTLYSQVNSLRITDYQRNYIKQLILNLKDNSIEEKILDNVSKPKLIIESPRDEIRMHERLKLLAVNFAKEIVKDNIDLKPYFKILLTGEQFYSFDFGKTYSQLKGEDSEFLDALVGYILELHETNYNLSFFLGYLSELKEDQKKYVFDQLIKNKSSYAFNVFRNVEFNYKNVSDLLDIVKSGNAPSSSVLIIKYEVIKLPPEELLKYFQKISKFENGRLYILETLHILVQESKASSFKIDDKILNYLKQLFEIDNYLLQLNNSNLFDLYYWEELCFILLEKYKKDIAPLIASHIIEFYRNVGLFSQGYIHIANVAVKTLEMDFENIWGIYSQLLIDRESILFWNIFNISFIASAEPSNPFFNISHINPNIIKWLEDHTELVPSIVRVAPIFSQDGEGWFPLTLRLIEDFSDDPRVFEELSASLFSMTTVGSRVPYLETRRDLLIKLSNHENQNISSWAKQEILNYNKQIQREKISDEEGYLGL